MAQEYLPPAEGGLCIHHLIEQQAELHPGAIALRYKNVVLKYDELNRRANRLAHYLRARGATTEALIAVSVTPSIESVIIALAVLKSGAAYMLLPATQPVDRLRSMLDDAKPLLLLSATPQRHALLPTFFMISLEECESSIDNCSEHNPVSGVTPDNMAFVRYTSGTTGKPKGVVNIHRSITSRLVHGPLPDLQSTDICAVNTSLGFGSRLFLPLAIGGTLVVVSEEEMRENSLFLRMLGREDISSIYMVPTQLRQLLTTNRRLKYPLERLRVVSVGGEQLTSDVICAFQKALPHVMLVNLYGSNEIGTTAALRVITGVSDPYSKSIGLPVGGTDIYVLDPQMQQVSAGDSGEICVASNHLARGYLNNEAITKERFLSNPFSNNSGSRMYRTGDVGRIGQNGELQFIGRADNQVKIHGYRVELEEVEAALLRHEAVYEATVVSEGEATTNRLIACVMAQSGSSLDTKQLREHLRSIVPHYMIPSVFIFLDSIPRSRSGKVDRAKLRSVATSTDSLEPNQLPRNIVESTLLEAWTTAFQSTEIGIRDDFLDLGGDSVVATNLLSDICERFGIDLSYGMLLAHPTIADMATLIAND